MAAGLSVDLDRWRREFDELMQRIGGRFARVEPRRRMAVFIRGLLAGLPRVNGEFVHPARVENPLVLLWIRTEDFFRNYRGKPVVFGHTRTEFLPQELSSHTPDDPTDLFAGENAIGIDTGCGHGGFLTAVELPALHVYESR
jgi:diadenosine tetraphosphatase ApaH/serine/threonine PP2A family protein phosphatase